LITSLVHGRHIAAEKKLIDPAIYYSGNDSLNPKHECSQYHWAHNVHLGGESTCTAPWKTLQRNWSPKDSPVEVDKQLKMQQYGNAEARFEKLLNQQPITDEHVLEATNLVKSNLITLFPDVLVDVKVQSGGQQSLGIPLVHHVAKMMSQTAQTDGKSMRDFPHFRDLLIALLDNRVSPSVATMNALDNPAWVNVLTHCALDVELNDKFATSFANISPFMRKDVSAGISIVHLLLQDNEAKIVQLLMRVQQYLRDMDLVDTDSMLESLSGCNNTLLDSHYIKGLLSVSGSFRSVLHELLVSQGTAMISRSVVLAVQDELAVHYMESWAKNPAGFDHGEWAIVTPANKFSVMHLIARHHMPKSFATMLQMITGHHKPQDVQKILEYILCTADAWLQRTPFHFAALHHGTDSVIYRQMVHTINEYSQMKPMVWRDVTNKSPNELAKQFIGDHEYVGAVGGRPANLSYSSRESGGWGVVPSSFDTALSEVYEARGRIQKGAHLTGYILKADPSIVRGAVALSSRQSFSRSDVDDIIARKQWQAGTISLGFALQPPIPLDQESSTIMSIVEEANRQSLVCFESKTVAAKLSSLLALIENAPGMSATKKNELMCRASRYFNCGRMA
jgi:hypothetical protein